MSAPSVIATATLKFGSATYKCKALPAGKPRSCEAIDVTCLDDGKKQFAPGALLVNGEITATIAGDSAPDENSQDALSIVLGSAEVECGDAIVRSVTPSTIEVGGNRERTFEVVFQPVGAAAS